MTAQQQAYRAPAARCPVWCDVTPEEHRADRGDTYIHGRQVYASPEVDPGLPEIEVHLMWCPDNDWHPADPYGTDTPAVHLEIHTGYLGKGYTPAEAREVADRLVRAAEALREAAALLVEAGVL